MLNPWPHLLRLLGRYHDQAHALLREEDYEDDAALPAVDPVADPYRSPAPGEAPLLHTVGAWCGSSSLRNPERDAKFAADHGIDRLDIIVNDHSGWRQPQNFTIRDRDDIMRLAAACHARDISVHFLSWVMPHADYLHQAAGVLIDLCRDAEAESLVWDAEEPWTLAKRPMAYAKAGALVGALFEELSCPMGVTGIGYAPVRKLKRLAQACSHTMPQCYPTSSSGLPPATTVTKFQARWAKRFGRPVLPALPAYRQTGIAGYTPEEAILAAARDAAQYSDTVVYWSLNAIRKSPEVARAIASLRRSPTDA